MNNRLIAALSSGACIVAMAAPAAAQAQTRDYDIPAGSLRSALGAYVRQSGRQVIYRGGEMKGVQSRGVRGAMTQQKALDAILAGTGFGARNGASGAVAIYRLGDPEGAGAQSLGPQKNEIDSSSGEANAARPSVESESAIITVIGTRIRGGQVISPTTIQSRTQIESQGLSDLGGFARSLTQNFAGGQNPGVIGGGSQGGSENLTSSSTLNLRGLGPDATLTLINGHRVAYDGASQGVDISAIPLAAVERVEVVTDGASALYGSDAVGGVANVILRRDFDGALASIRVGAATDGGDVEQRYSLVGGRRWTGGGFMATLDFLDATAIVARQRSYTQSLSGTNTVVPGQEQFGAVVAGHQQLFEGATFEIDGQYNDRRNGHVCTSFTTTADCFASGAFNRNKVRSYSVTPTIRLDLPGRWGVALSATNGGSNSNSNASTLAQGNPISVSRAHYNNSTNAVEINAEGALFDLPGGEVRLAVGGGYRSLSLDADVRLTQGGVTTPTWVFNQRRDVYFAYGELSLPLVGPGNATPLLRALRVTGALRYERNSDVGHVATPKLGLIYNPHADIAVSATWGRSFKAPTLFQLGRPPLGFLLPGVVFSPAGPGGLPIIYLQGGNAGLRPERATTWTANLTLTPNFMEGLRIGASYFDIRYRDRVVQPVDNVLGALQPLYRDYVILSPSSQQVQAAVASLPSGLTNQSGGPFNPAAVGAIVDGRLLNAARQSLHGVDLTADYRIEIGPSQRVRVATSLSYLESRQQLSSGRPTVERAGTIFDPPHWRGRAAITWERGNFELTGVMSHVGGTLDDRRQPFRRVGAFTTLDAVTRLRTARARGPFANIEITLSVLNFLNEKPDLIRESSPTAYPFDSTNYSSIGRAVSLAVSKQW